MARKRKPNDPWMTLPQAAAILGCHRQTVAAMAIRGELRSQVVGGFVFVHEADVERERRARDQTADAA